MSAPQIEIVEDLPEEVRALVHDVVRTIERSSCHVAVFSLIEALAIINARTAGICEGCGGDPARLAELLVSACENYRQARASAGS